MKTQPFYIGFAVLMIMSAGLMARDGIQGPATAMVLIGGMLLGVIGTLSLLYVDRRRARRSKGA